MPIAVTCGNCQSKMTAKDELAGKTVRCPKCREPVAIPTSEPSVSRSAIRAPAAPTVNPSAVKPATRTATKKPNHGLPKAPEERYAAMQPLAMRAFDGEIDPVHSSFSYKLGMALAVSVLVLLPLVYVALIGVVGYAVYWHSTSHLGVFNMAGELRGRNSGRGFCWRWRSIWLQL